MKNGETVEYQSVRTHPTPERVAVAEAHYAVALAANSAGQCRAEPSRRETEDAPRRPRSAPEGEFM